jgi:squalene synthase HpnC
MVDAPTGPLFDPDAAVPTLEQARADCLRLARSHYENFTVLSWLAPRRMRKHLAAVYAYCRAVDDLGDEGRLPSMSGTSRSETEPRAAISPAERLGLLDRFEEELDAAYAGRPHHAIFVALRSTIESFDLPREPFARLIEANRIDQRAVRHPDFDSLLHYCRHSADPVGRLVLMLYGFRDEERFALSDATCTALQLANFWQDVARDRRIGRVYLPQDDMERHGVSESDLDAPTASAPLRALIRFEVERACDLFAKGLPLLDRVPGRLRLELALFSRGGLAILAKLAEQDYDPLVRRPEVSGAEKTRILLSTIFSGRGSRWI